MRCHLSFHMFLRSPNEKDKENEKLNLLSLSYCDSQRLNYLVQIISQRVPSPSSWNYSLLVKLITFHIKMHGTFAEYHRVHLYIVHIPNMLQIPFHCKNKQKGICYARRMMQFQQHIAFLNDCQPFTVSQRLSPITMYPQPPCFAIYRLCVYV